MILIESDHWRLWCDPQIGVQWMAAEVQRQGTWHAVVPDCREASPSNATTSLSRAGQNVAAPLPAANFHMLPYSNRIRDGRFEFQGQSVQLADADKHAIHGALRKLPWKIASSDSHSLTCTLHSSDHPELNWPWAIDATIKQSIDGDRLSSTLILTNRAETDMPAGFGWHPYFVREVNGSEPTLTLPVQGIFPDEAGDCLPDGAPVELPNALDFRQAKSLDKNQRIDCCLSELNGPCVIDWKDGGIQLHMTASEICRFLILYNPDMPHFAVEPVTNANDAFNLASQGVDAGVEVLKPGQSMEATMTLQAIVT
ncbi:hypothetical protein [Granulosicoccus antarcticus]|uniref:Aldose 1-epimerase n=1 Tax=Granulosicoccus antarcticus IMCC3135 TaxID=1192854 RepID=A0A2Z2NMJ0_9GAMM|nr:hypothetical protein [Granulosicoccus antarcticus]ASJ72423.1 Aldose 1-epimerase [Granulosicoccus antarcticus IMCC3135]